MDGLESSLLQASSQLFVLAVTDTSFAVLAIKRRGILALAKSCRTTRVLKALFATGSRIRRGFLSANTSTYVVAAETDASFRYFCNQSPHPNRVLLH